MKRKVILMRIASILMLAMMMTSVLSVSVLADEPEGKKSIISSDITQFDSTEEDTGTSATFRRFVGTLIRLIQIVGVGVAIVMLIVLAIKYISAAPSEKAELKKTAVIYVVGAIVLFAATGILQIIKNFADRNVKAYDANGKEISMLIDTIKVAKIYYLGA